MEPEPAFDGIDVFGCGTTRHHQLAERLAGIAALLLIEVFHEQNTIEMVELVLEQPREELVGFDTNLVSIEVMGLEMDLFRPHDLPCELRYGETALFELPLPAGLDDPWVHEHLWPIADVIDEESFLYPDLWRGEADPWRLVHRFEHVVGEPLEPAVDLVDIAGALFEHGIADDPDRVGGHGGSGYPGYGRAVAGEQYFEADPTSASKPRTITVRLAGEEVELATDRGVFSPAELDDGTDYLLRKALRNASGTKTILDLGCGYGPVAVAIAKQVPDATVWAVDVNGRARELSEENATRLGLGNVRVADPADVPTELRFDRIYSNPPIRIGKQALHDLLSTWLRRLAPDGRAYLVVNRNLGSDSLARWLEQSGWTTTRLGSRRGFRVLEISHP